MHIGRGPRITGPRYPIGGIAGGLMLGRYCWGIPDLGAPWEGLTRLN